jgi:aminoglycoside phosphotransferase family enzyme/predicted kinase
MIQPRPHHATRKAGRDRPSFGGATTSNAERRSRDDLGESNARFPDPIAALLDPRIYPHPATQVEVIQTHISWVFLAGDVAYKVKKPVDFGFLDFSTLRRRLHCCRQEVILNRRLCPDLYLGVVPIRLVDGGYRIGGRRGHIVEYAVAMRRLPQDRMLDRLLVTGQATSTMIDAIADTLARFHARSATGPAIARYGSLRAIRRNWVENFDQAAGAVGHTITRFQYAYLHAWVRATLTREHRLFQRRVQEGHVRDGHGDLRASAICVTDRLCIFDCIEFNHRFRYADVAADVAFLAMDLDAHDRPDLAEHFLRRYVADAGDPGLLEVIDFYRCYRAFVRGKVESMRAAEAEVGRAERADARRIARDRFALAVDYAGQRQPPRLLITCGLSGTGKSVVARALAGRDDLVILASDVVRKQLAGLDPATHQRRGYQAGIYSPAATRRTYRELLRRGRQLLLAGRSVVLDATFSRREWRTRAATLADQVGALFLCVECRAAEVEVCRRIAERARDPRATSDAGWETYLAQRATFEPVDELSEWQHIVLDTVGAPDAVAATAIREIDARLHPTPFGRGDGHRGS